MRILQCRTAWSRLATTTTKTYRQQPLAAALPVGGSGSTTTTATTASGSGNPPLVASFRCLATTTSAASSSSQATSTTAAAAATTTTTTTLQQQQQQDARDARFGYAVSGAAVLSAFVPLLLSSRSSQKEEEELYDDPPHHCTSSSKYVVCEAATPTAVSSLTPVVVNPLSAGVSSAQVNALVDECLADPSINIRAIPDAVERALYQTTIQLTLNLVYQLLGRLHGATILRHELRLERTTNLGHHSNNNELSLSQLRDNLNEPLLEDMAARLVASSHINQTLIPDALEVQLYANCLKIMFRLLDLLSATLAVQVCGHTFRLEITPQDKELLWEDWNKSGDNNNTNHQTSSLAGTPINSQLLLEYALQQQGGVDLAERARQNQSLLGRLLWPFRQDVFVAQLQASLYGLFLALLDHVLERCSVQLLQDRVTVDLVPLTDEEWDQRQRAQGALVATDDDSPHSDGGGGGYLALASFTMGVGVGLSLMAYALNPKQRPF